MAPDDWIFGLLGDLMLASGEVIAASSAVSAFESYPDIKRFISRDQYDEAMRYVSWHNSLAGNQPLEIWLALIVAMAAKQGPIDPSHYGKVMLYLKDLEKLPPKDGKAFKAAALKLTERNPEVG